MNLETSCKRCLFNFEYTNVLKSHLLFDICSKSLLTMSAKYDPTSPISSSSTSSTPSLLKPGSSSSSPQKKSAFIPINHQTKLNDSKGIKRSYLANDSVDQHSNKYMKQLKSETTNDYSKKEHSTNALPSSSSVIEKKQQENDLDRQSSPFKNEMFKNRQPASLLSKSLDWKITFLDGTQTVELNMADDLGKPKKTHVCLFCGKIYNRKYGLKIHLRTHTGYKPLKCKVCSRPFSDPSNLNKHVRLHSQGETPYRCPYCGKVLVRKRDLDRHIISRHTSSSSGGNNDTNDIGEKINNDEDDIDVDGDDEYNNNSNADESNEKQPITS